MSKGVLGFGDSFMWGESIYFYSNLENLPFGNVHSYNHELITQGMWEYKNRYRYINLVSENYDTWNTTVSTNGSNNQSNLDILNKIYLNDVIEHPQYNFKLNINDYSLLVFQFTSIYRGDTNMDDMLLRLDNIFNNLESKNIKVCTLVWMPEFFNNKIYQDRFLDRHVDICVDEVTVSCFEDVIHNHRLNITVKSDFEKDNLQINDIHLNHKGNRCFADSIIKKLQQDNFKI